MLTLSELFQIVDQLPDNEFVALREHMLAQHPESGSMSGMSGEERARRLMEGLAHLVEGLTPSEIEEMVAAMNEEYLEPPDDSEWLD
jgi:hypothetical protein